MGMLWRMCIMNFERGKNPMEGMSIGRIGIPILINGLFTSESMGDPTVDATIGFSIGNMSDKDSRRILEGIERGEINFWEGRYQCGVINSKEYHMTKYSLECLSDYKGHYVLFQGKKYFIPE